MTNLVSLGTDGLPVFTPGVIITQLIAGCIVGAIVAGAIVFILMTGIKKVEREIARGDLD